MTWLIKRNRKGDKYKIWSTVTDNWIIGWFSSREEILNFIFKERMKSFIEEWDKEKKTFPNGWTDKDTGKVIFTEPKG